MQLPALILVAALLQLTSAQTPNGFIPVVTQNLNVTFGSNVITPPGELIPRPEVASPPTISSKVFSTTGKAILFLIDLDVPSNGTRVKLLHWFAPDITGVTSGLNSTTLTIPANGPGAPYLQPSPPPGDSPHRYTFLLFEQPINFAVPAAFANINPPASTTNRIGFNLTAFIAAANLSPPIAANYILVQNTTAPATSTSFPPSSVTTTAGSGGSGANSTALPTGGPATASASGGSGASSTALPTGGPATASASGSTTGTHLARHPRQRPMLLLPWLVDLDWRL